MSTRLTESQPNHTVWRTGRVHEEHEQSKVSWHRSELWSLYLCRFGGLPSSSTNYMRIAQRPFFDFQGGGMQFAHPMQSLFRFLSAPC